MRLIKGVKLSSLSSKTQDSKSFTMKSLLLAAILFVTVLDQVEARCKKAPVSSAVIKKKLEAFTQMKKNDKGKWVPVAESPCWYDLTKNNCGTCKKGGKQCGYPMSKYCQSPKSKTVSLRMDFNGDDINLNF